MSKYPIGLSVEEGSALIQAAFSVIDTEEVELTEALGRVLAKDIIAEENVPPYARSPYDGYAFRAADLATASKEHPVTLTIIEEVPAGHTATKTVETGQAIKILTGAPFPKGADTIEKFEVTEFTDSQVTFFAPVKEGSNVVPLGEDMKVGEQVLVKGRKITPGAAGILASLGITKVPVYRKPRIAIISTGDELVAVDQSLSEGKLRNSSAYALAAFLQSWGMQPKLYGIVRDEVDAIASLVTKAAAECDVVLTTGGVSVGDYDCMQRVCEAIGARVLYWKTKMKPGSAFLASVYEKAGKETPLLCLSGNPSAAAVALMLVCRPALGKLQGLTDYELPKIEVVLDQDFKKKSPQRRFIPARLEYHGATALGVTSQKSGNGMVSPLDGVDLLVEVPAGSPPCDKGEIFSAYLVR